MWGARVKDLCLSSPQWSFGSQVQLQKGLVRGLGHHGGHQGRKPHWITRRGEVRPIEEEPDVVRECATTLSEMRARDKEAEDVERAAKLEKEVAESKQKSYGNMTELKLRR